MAAPWATYPRHSSLSCAIFPSHVNAWGSQGRPAQGAQDLGMQSWGWVTTTGPGNAAVLGPRRSSCEGSVRFAASRSFLPLFSTRDTVPRCHGGGESLPGCFCCTMSAVNTAAQRDQTHARTVAPPLQLRSVRSPAAVTITDRSLAQCWTPDQHQAGKIWPQRTLPLKNSTLLTCARTRICAFQISSPKRNGVKTEPHLKPHPFFLISDILYLEEEEGNPLYSLNKAVLS